MRCLTSDAAPRFTGAARLDDANRQRRQATVQIGDIAGAIIRGNAAARARARGGDRRWLPPCATSTSRVTAAIGHISFGIENWNTERVRAELIKRDVVYIDKDGKQEPRPDMTGTLESFHVPDAMGWDLQIGNKIAPTRNETR